MWRRWSRVVLVCVSIRFHACYRSRGELKLGLTNKANFYVVQKSSQTLIDRQADQNTKFKNRNKKKSFRIKNKCMEFTKTQGKESNSKGFPLFRFFLLQILTSQWTPLHVYVVCRLLACIDMTRAVIHNPVTQCTNSPWLINTREPGGISHWSTCAAQNPT
jgi:hypothetical protein